MSHTYAECHHLGDIKTRLHGTRTKLFSPFSPETPDCQHNFGPPMRDSTHPFEDSQISQIVDEYVASPHRPDGVRTARTD